MTAAVDNSPACARLWTVAPAGELPTAPTPRGGTRPLRKAAARTVDALWQVIGEVIDMFTPNECANYFASAGYDTD